MSRESPGGGCAARRIGARACARHDHVVTQQLCAGQSASRRYFVAVHLHLYSSAYGSHDSSGALRASGPRVSSGESPARISPLLAPPSLPPPFTHPRTLRQRRWLPPMLPILPTGYSRQSSSRGFRRGCRSRLATPSQAPPLPALPLHRPPPRQHPVSAGWVYPSVQRWLARLSRCETSRVALCARSPAASPSGGGGGGGEFVARARFFGAEAVLFQAVTGSHAYTCFGRCRAERVRHGDDARPHPAAHAPDIHPRRGVDIRP